MEILLEILLQIIMESFWYLSTEVTAKKFVRKKLPFGRAAFLYSISGIICGGISLLLFPSIIIENPRVQMANLVLTPMICGFFMMEIGRIKSKKGKSTNQLAGFVIGSLFALTMALTRYFFAN